MAAELSHQHAAAPMAHNKFDYTAHRPARIKIPPDIDRLLQGSMRPTLKANPYLKWLESQTKYPRLPPFTGANSGIDFTIERILSGSRDKSLKTGVRRLNGDDISDSCGLFDWRNGLSGSRDKSLKVLLVCRDDVRYRFPRYKIASFKDLWSDPRDKYLKTLRLSCGHRREQPRLSKRPTCLRHRYSLLFGWRDKSLKTSVARPLITVDTSYGYPKRVAASTYDEGSRPARVTSPSSSVSCRSAYLTTPIGGFRPHSKSQLDCTSS